MSDAARKRSARAIGTDFGIFYPVGYIVAGLPEPPQAEQVRHDLLSGGYEAQDCAMSAPPKLKKRLGRISTTTLVSWPAWAGATMQPSAPRSSKEGCNLFADLRARRSRVKPRHERRAQGTVRLRAPRSAGDG